MSKTRLIKNGSPLIAITLALLTACNPAPKYSKPPTPIPTAYKESAPDQFKEGTGWKVATPGDDKIRPKWWEMYNDPQLNKLEDQVAVSNQTVKQAEANFRAARALVVSARSSLFPTIGSSASYARSHFPSSNPTNSAASSGRTLNNYDIAADISYSIDLWHKVRNTVAANSYSAQASAADVATALLSTQAELAQDYFEVRALDTEEGILQDTLNNYRQDLQLTTALFSAGIDSDEDVSQAQTQLDTATAQATDLRVARAQYEHAIATLIGKPAAAFSLEVAPFVPSPPSVPVALPSVLLERRPDIAAAERLVAAANAQVGVARAAYYPLVNLTASGAFESAIFSSWFTWPSRVWSLGPSLSQTLLDFGARRGAVEQAEASYDSSVAAYRQAVLTDFQAVEDNLSSLRFLSQEVSEYDASIKSASHYLDLALTRYKAGIDAYLDVVLAQNSVLSNRETQVQVQLRQMAASVSLVMALGGGWDASQLPKYDQFLTKPPKWSPQTAPAGPPLPPAPANPPAVPPIQLPSAPAVLFNSPSGEQGQH